MYIDVGIEASACAYSADTIQYDTIRYDGTKETKLYWHIPNETEPKLYTVKQKQPYLHANNYI